MGHYESGSVLPLWIRIRESHAETEIKISPAVSSLMVLVMIWVNTTISLLLIYNVLIRPREKRTFIFQKCLFLLAKDFVLKEKVDALITIAQNGQSSM
jgi:hypothetical protein